MKKKLLLLVLLACSLFNKSHAQITLDTVFNYSYPAGPYPNLIRLEKSGFKWMLVDSAHNVTLLNMDHSVFKQFTYPAAPSPIVTYLFYVTEMLFNNDSTNVEYLLSFYDQNASHRYVKIYDETGNMLFYRDSSFVAPWWGSGASPNELNGSITNTDSGAVMVLLRNEGALSDEHTEVYRMPGYLQCSSCVDPLRLMPLANFVPPVGQNPPATELKAFPNPSGGKTTIEYDMPAKYSKGIMDIIDMNGQLIRSYKISTLFKSIIIEKGELPAGTYNCIVKSGEVLISKKFIRIN